MGHQADVAQHSAHALGDGRFLVPCVRANVDGVELDNTARWWPIIGRWHEDTEIISFRWWHVHIDWRFVKQEHYTRALSACRHGAGPIAQVIVADAIVAPEGNRAAIDPGASEPGSVGTQWLRHEIRRPNERPALLWPAETRWLSTLEWQFRHTRLGGRNARTCPHKGTDLSGIAPDAHGEIECPLHGLRWCHRTGEARPRAGTAREREPNDHTDPRARTTRA